MIPLKNQGPQEKPNKKIPSLWVKAKKVHFA